MQEGYKILTLVQRWPFSSFWEWPRWGAGQLGDLASVLRWLRWNVAGRCLLLDLRCCLDGKSLLLDKGWCLNWRIPSKMDSRFLPTGLQKRALLFSSHNPHNQSGLQWISSSYKISFCKLKRRKKSQQIKTNKLTAVGIKSIWGKWSMNVSNFVNECQHQWRETKVNITGKKMRSKHSLAADKQQRYKIYFVFRLTQHLDPSCDRDQAGVDWTLRKSQAGREPNNCKRSWKIFNRLKFEPPVMLYHALLIDLSRLTSKL